MRWRREALARQDGITATGERSCVPVLVVMAAALGRRAGAPRAAQGIAAMAPPCEIAISRSMRKLACLARGCDVRGTVRSELGSAAQWYENATPMLGYMYS